MLAAMKANPAPIRKLIQELNKLPGIGSKTSERFVYHLLRQPKTEIDALVQELQAVKDSIQTCSECYTYTEENRCSICTDPSRNKELICVVAEPKDVIAIEKTSQFDGLYHVLGGVINHVAGVGPEELRVQELLKRIDSNGVQEIIIATNPDMEGETTSLYIAQSIGKRPVTITRIARGLPMGANIEFADEVTLGNALTGRREINT